MAEKMPQPSELGKKKIPKELKEKIFNRETLEAKDIGLVTSVALRLTAEKFLSDQGESVPDFAFRNPAVLLDSITATHFNELPNEVKDKIKSAAGISKELLNSHYGESANENIPYATYDNEYSRDISGPILGMQTLVNMRDIGNVDQKDIGLIAKELGEVFEDLWGHGMEKKWGEMTKEDKLKYYSGNACAAINFELR